jgi:predicted glycoside hydrolase/deacetylase ChbG (UPF0249 family)
VKPNPVLKQLGLPDDARVVIFHADDIGMCQASLTAYHDLLDFGLLSAAAVMVPCPWFPATAAFCRQYQEQLAIDVGVHLTLTSEWDGFRWGPISTRNPRSGLMDEDGYFHATTEEMQANATADAVLREVEAQIERALAGGFDITHIDSHMGSIFHPNFLAGYIAIATKYRLPALFLRQDEEQIRQMAAREGAPLDTVEVFVQQIRALEEQNYPMLDNIHVMPLDTSVNRLEHAREILNGLPAGITYFIIHPARDTPELRAITPDWQARVADHSLFTNQAWRDYVNNSGVHVIGYRDLRDLLRT